MGLPSPQEAAPPYDDVVHNHALSRFTPSSSASGYTAVPQDDVEQNAHDHSAPSPTPQPQESIAQTIASVFRPKPHVHCEVCDAQTEAREMRAQKRHCCSMVATVFIVLFICLMILGIIITSTVAKSKRHMH